MGPKFCLQVGPIETFLTHVVSPRDGPYSGPHKASRKLLVALWPHWITPLSLSLSLRARASLCLLMLDTPDEQFATMKVSATLWII